MRWALLGGGEEAAALAAAVRESGDRIVAAYDVPGEDPIWKLSPRLPPPQDEWEELLHGTVADVVIVGRTTRDAAAREDQLRKLVQAGVSLIVVHPGCEAIVGFELEMIRRDSGAEIFCYVPLLWEPAIERLDELLHEEGPPLGALRQVTLERQHLRAPGGAPWPSLAGDAELIRHWLGPVRLVSALAGTTGEDLDSLFVQVTTIAGGAAHWSSAPARRAAGLQVTLIGERGEAEVWLPDMPAEDATHLMLRDDAGEQSLTIDPGKPASRFLEAWRRRREVEAPLEPSWSAACRDVELAETAQQSLRRNKTLEIFHEEHSEQQTFKGMMAAGGCLALLLTFFAFLFIMLLDSLLPLEGAGWWRAWPICLFTPLAIFLLIQFLQVILALDRRSKNDQT